MDCDGISNNIQDKKHKIHELVRIVNPDSWNVEEAVVPSEEKLPDFCKVFRHEISVNDFRDYVENVTRNYHTHVVPETVHRAKNIINTIAVSFAEAERGFSVMNLINRIYSDKRNRLEVKNLANLLVINLIGLMLDLWDCSDSVRMWLRNQNTADDTRVKKHHTSEQKYDENRISMWKYLSK